NTQTGSHLPSCFGPELVRNLQEEDIFRPQTRQDPLFFNRLRGNDRRFCILHRPQISPELRHLHFDHYTGRFGMLCV
ncbi:hypothetical protein PtB15_14B413, partial [Puccinia triticina]